MALEIDRREQTADAVEAGRILYVSGNFYEAHERWEVAWQAETGLARRLLQGLILAAAAYHKMSRQRQPLGMAILLEKALERLGPLPDGSGGLDLTRFRQGLEISLREARRWSDGGPVPAGPAHLARAFSSPRDDAAAAAAGA